MAQFFTLVAFTPDAEANFGWNEGRNVRSYQHLGIARQQRNRSGRSMKRSTGEAGDVRILRTIIHNDGTTETEWVE